MSLRRTAAKRDKNERPIIEALTAAGASVQQLSAPGVPDLLVSFYSPDDQRSRTILMEVKDKGGRLTPAESAFIAEWKGEIYIVWDIEDALEAIGRL